MTSNNRYVFVLKVLFFNVIYIVSKKSPWNTTVTTELILLYEQYPCLYNIKSKDYHNKNERQKAVSEICQKLSVAELTTEIVQKKIHGIRSQYMAEVAKVKKSKNSGCSTDDLYTPKLWCFDLLYFLADNTKAVTEGDSNLSQEIFLEDEEEGTEVVFEGTLDEFRAISPVSSSNVTSNAPPVRKFQKRKKNMETDSADVVLAKAADLLSNMEETEIDLFSKYIAAELKKIPDEGVVDDIKMEIMTALHNGKNKLKNKQNI